MTKVTNTLLVSAGAVVAAVLAAGATGAGYYIRDSAPVPAAQTTTVTAAPTITPGTAEDEEFFAIMSRYTIGYASREDAARAAKTVCSAVSAGASFGDMETQTIDYSRQHGGAWTVRDADQFMFAAISAYCPFYVGVVPQSSLVPR